MNQKYNFDLVDRKGTSSLKYDARQDTFGRTDLIPLWVADMDFATAPAITNALIERATHPVYGYTQYPESMLEALIDWIKRRHNWDVKREWIVMCPGVVPSIHAVVKALTKLEESVIVQPPVYFPFFSAVTDTRRSLIHNPLKLEENNYKFDFDHFEHCASKAKMLLLCSPHNPVGRVWSQDELKTLLQIAKKHELIIFSDEVHADLIYAPHKHHMLAKIADDSSNIITAIAPSKTFNIAGLNLSVLIIPNASHRIAVNSIFNDLHLSAANPFSIVAFQAAYQNGEEWLNAALDYLKETRDFVANYLINKLPQIKLVSPEGTYLLWLDCRAMAMTDSELKHFFVNIAGVGLSPGVQFGEAGSGFMRMNIGTSRQTISKALDKINAAFRHNAS